MNFFLLFIPSSWASNEAPATPVKQDAEISPFFCHSVYLHLVIVYHMSVLYEDSLQQKMFKF